MQIGVYSAFCQEGGILLQSIAIDMGWSRGVRGRYDSPVRALVSLAGTTSPSGGDLGVPEPRSQPLPPNCCLHLRLKLQVGPASLT